MEQWLTWQMNGGFLAALSVFWLSYLVCWVWLRRESDSAASIGRLVSFTAGLFAISLSALSAVDALANESLTMHMVQHLLLVYVAPPLLLLSRPLSIWRVAFSWRAGKQRPTAASGLQNTILNGLNFVLKPPVAWSLSTAALLVWHIPSFYDYALAHEMVHENGEHMTLFLTFLAWWHPLLGSLPRFHYLSGRRQRFVYLLAGMAPVAALGLFLLFYPHALYGYYASATPLGGLSGLGDQQVGALVMLSGGMAVLAAMALPMQYYDTRPLTYP